VGGALRGSAVAARGGENTWRQNDRTLVKVGSLAPGRSNTAGKIRRQKEKSDIEGCQNARGRRQNWKKMTEGQTGKNDFAREESERRVITRTLSRDAAGGPIAAP